MKYSFAALAFPAGATAQYLNATYTTEIVSVLTTVCPSATQLTHNGITYTILKATTLTITDCPCTLTHTVVPTPEPSTVLYTSCPPSASAPPAPIKSIVPPPYSPLSVIYSTPTKGPFGTGSLTATTPGPIFTFASAANANRAAGVLAAIGVVAAFAL